MAKKSPPGKPYDLPPLKPTDIGPTPPDPLPPDAPALFVSLVNIDAGVLAGVEVGDFVVLRVSARPIPVSTLVGQRLGNISTDDQEKVLVSGRTSGRVSEASVEIPTCVVQIL